MPTNETWSLAFVDSISASPTVRLNLCSETVGPWNLRVGTRFDPPPLRRAIGSSLLADGAAPSSAAYDNRTITLVLQLTDTGGQMDADPGAWQFQMLIRELDRTTNILRYQPGTSAPVFFRTYRSGPETIEWDPTNREVTCSVLAEPFALGLEETLSSVGVINNPAAGSNGLFFDVTGVKGDVETPLTLTMGSTLVGTGRRRSAASVRRRGNPANVPFFLQAESMTLAANVTVLGSDSAVSGGSCARIAYTGSTALIQRLSTSTRFPATASTDARGMYRVFARTRQSVGTDQHTIQLRWGAADAQVTNSIAKVPKDIGPNAPTLTMIDLGQVQMPAGFDPVERGMTGVEIPTEGVFLAIDTGRTSGTGTLDIDYLLFLPIDDRTTYVDWPAASVVTDFVLSGGPAPRAYARNASGQITSTQAIMIAGVGLMISPGVTNRIFFHRDVGTGSSVLGLGDTISATTTVVPSYYPRYLFVRPVAS